MHRLVLLAAFLAYCTPMFAGSPLQPPARFDHPYPGQLTVVRFDKVSIAKECSAIAGGRAVRSDAAGCQFFDDVGCTVYLAVRTRRASIDAILRHEIAHCNGWPGDHPD